MRRVMCHARGKIGLQLVDALLGLRPCETFDELHAEVGRVVFIEECLALVQWLSGLR